MTVIPEGRYRCLAPCKGAAFAKAPGRQCSRPARPGSAYCRTHGRHPMWAHEPPTQQGWYWSVARPFNRDTGAVGPWGQPRIIFKKHDDALVRAEAIMYWTGLPLEAPPVPR